MGVRVPRLRRAGWITGETIHVTGGSRISIGYLTYMHHVTEGLAAAGPSATPGRTAG